MMKKLFFAFVILAASCTACQPMSPVTTPELTAEPLPTHTLFPSMTAPTATATPTEPAPATASMEIEEITFQSGHFTLVGDLQIPATEEKHPAIIMVHGDGGIDRYGFGTYRPVMERFLRAGYAVFSWDKPGTGASRGKLANDGAKLSQRAAILVSAAELLKEHPAIDHERIGAWGISQGGYVIPLALRMTDDIAFMIVVSGPAMDSYDQGAYLLGQMAFCAGASQEEARFIEQHLSAADKAITYQDYYENTVLLQEHPKFQAMGLSLNILSESEWKPEDRGGLAFFDPIEVIERTTIPVLAFFGEKDRQVDPFQGAQAYQEALQKAGNRNYRVELIPGVDHNIVLCETGCLAERDKRSRADWLKYAPEYLDWMEEWLVQLADF